MKNTFNYRSLSTLAGLAAAAVVAGCAHTAKLHGENFTSDDEPTAIGRIAQAQSAAGAKEDAMLYDMNFHGDKLNSLGEGKLDLIVKATPDGDPVYIYLNMPHDQVAERQTSVTAYLKSAGVSETKIVVAEGPNLNKTTPTAYNLKNLYKKDGTTFDGEAAEDTSAAGGGGGGPAPASH